MWPETRPVRGSLSHQNSALSLYGSRYRLCPMWPWGFVSGCLLDGSRVSLGVGPRPFCDDRYRPRFLLTANDRGRPIVPRDAAGSGTAVLAALFPQLGGVEVLGVEDLEPMTQVPP